MRDLPLAARWYLLALWTLAAALLGAQLLQVAALIDHLPLLLLWLSLFILADYFEVDFEIGDGKPVAMTVADAPMIFLVAVAGAMGVVGVAIGTIIVDVLRRRDWYKSLFNASVRSITYQAMVLVYGSISVPGAPSFSGWHGLAALVATGAVYYTLNTLLVSTIIAFATRQPLLRVYQSAFRMVNWVHLITLPLGAILAVLWDINPWLLLPGVVPLVMAQRSFKAIAAWQAESRRNKALAHEAQQLAGRLERLQDTTTAMFASLEPAALLETVSTRLALLLEAAASWVVLLDATAPRLVAARGIPPAVTLDAAAYAAELRDRGVRQLDAADLARLHGVAATPWQTMVIIPLALEGRLLGGIYLALERPLVLAEDDCRVLLAFAAQAALAMEHARLFDELRRKQDELVRSSKLAALGTFSAGIAHEFNNLLAGVLGYAELGLMSDDVAEKDEALDVAVRACLRGRGITSGLLTFARRRDPQRALHQIRDAVDETLALVERELSKLNIRIERRLRPVPPTICDLGQIGQVLLNLITNARDAMIEQGGGTITIDLAQHGDQIELSVSDTGSGIPDELLEQIFQPFMTTKGALGGSATPGTGLGLAISYGIVESHGGTITPTSKLGQGTTMTVQLPITSQVSTSEEAHLSSNRVSSLRVLVVDDERVVAEALARLLEAHGHHVSVTAEGEQGLKLYREQPFDLVISDVVMPGMSGSEFMERLLAIDSQAQVLVMTGQNVSPQVDSMLHMGALGTLNKPFVVDDLLAAIARSAWRRKLVAA